MIPKSLIYKLVRKSDNIIIAEGNHKEIQKAIEHFSVQQHEQLVCRQVQISCDSGSK